MHLHPQWLNAEYRNNQWYLNFDIWALDSLENKTMQEVLSNGKQYLEDLLKPINEIYRCLAFRACGHYIQPSSTAVKNLVKTGFQCDTSIIKGLFEPPHIDFRSAFSNCLPWVVSEDDINLKSKVEKGLMEFPICSTETLYVPLIKKITNFMMRSEKANKYFSYFWCNSASQEDLEWFSEKDRLKRERYPIAERRSKLKNEKQKPFFFSRLIKCMISTILKSNLIILDYNDLPPKAFVECLKKAVKQKKMYLKNDSEIIIPLVALGHTKGMHNCDNIDRIIREIRENFSENELVFWTMSEAVEHWKKLIID